MKFSTIFFALQLHFEIAALLSYFVTNEIGDNHTAQCPGSTPDAVKLPIAIRL